MNQTYLIESEERSIEIKKSLSNSIYHENNKFKSNLILMDRNKYSHEQQLFKKKHEIKLKLNKMKKRTQLLLKNHNWRKYFTEDGEEQHGIKLANSKLMTQSLSETMFNDVLEDDFNSMISEENDVNEESSSVFTESSFVSTYEIQKLSHHTQLNDQQSKLNLFNYFNENKCGNHSQSMSSAAAALPQLSCSAFSGSIPFSTSEMFQVMSNCSIGGVSKTSTSVTSAAQVQSKFPF